MADATSGVTGSDAPKNVLIVGGAGLVGSILRPGLEAAHHVHYLDLKPVPEAEDRTTVADVMDDEVVQQAVAGMDAVVYLAMGRFNPEPEMQSMFDVNVQGVYRVLRQTMQAEVPRFIYASSLSVYRINHWPQPLDETAEPDSWKTYGLTKRLGECVCEAASRRYPEATITALRLMLPMTEQRWQALQTGESSEFQDSSPTGPRDLQRLFLAAIALSKPGLHIVQATGDTTDERYPNRRVRELLGWSPKGE